jgi:hypothetical protein
MLDPRRRESWHLKRTSAVARHPPPVANIGGAAIGFHTSRVQPRLRGEYQELAN